MAKNYAAKAKAKAKAKAGEKAVKTIGDLLRAAITAAKKQEEVLATDQSPAKFGDIWSVVSNNIHLCWVLVGNCCPDHPDQFLALPLDGWYQMVGTRDCQVFDAGGIPWAARCDSPGVFHGDFLATEGKRVGYMSPEEGAFLVHVFDMVLEGKAQTAPECVEADRILTEHQFEDGSTHIDLLEKTCLEAVRRQEVFLKVRMHSSSHSQGLN